MNDGASTRPGIVRGIAALGVLVASYCLWIGLGPFVEYLYLLVMSVPEGVQGTVGNLVWWLGLGAYGLWATRLLWKRKPRGPAETLLFLTLSIGSLVGRWSNSAIDYWAALGQDLGPSSLLRSYTGHDAQGIALFLAGLAMVVWLGRILLASESVRAWAGAEPASSAGFAPRRSLAAALGLAFLLFLVVGQFPFLVNTVLDGALPEGWAWPFELPGDVSALAPFLAAAGLVLWSATERLLIDDDGITLFLFRPRYRIFHARWDRVRFLDVVRHGNKPPTVVVHYRSRLGLPFSLGVHPDRYDRPELVADRLLALAADRQVKGRSWTSSPWVVAFGVLSMVAGVLFIRAGREMSTNLMTRYVDGGVPTTDLAKLAALQPLTVLYLAAVASLGLGFGLHSAYHRGGARPILLILLLAGIQYVPDPLLHWLVVIAMYAILTAVQSIPHLRGQGGIVSTIPSLAEWETWMGLVKAAPAFAGAAYVVGVVLGKWPWRLIRNPGPISVIPERTEGEALKAVPPRTVHVSQS